MLSIILYVAQRGDSDNSGLPLVLFYLALAAVNVAGYWRLFSKAGVPGWSALIPVYNLIKLWQISGRSGWWTLAFLVPFLNIYASVRLGLDLARAFGRGTGFGVGLFLLPPVFVPILGFGDSRYALAAANR